jgi:hypothetical protein
VVVVVAVTVAAAAPPLLLLLLPSLLPHITNFSCSVYLLILPFPSFKCYAFMFVSRYSLETSPRLLVIYLFYLLVFVYTSAA